MLDSDPEVSLGRGHGQLDIADGLRQVAEHLLGLGHRRFLHLAADVPSWTFEARA
jgi:DNA-binding LacI/PurR family transcriptional regulator